METNKKLFIVYLCIFTLAESLAWSGSAGRGGVGGAAMRGLGNPRSSNTQRSIYNGLGNANGDSSYIQPAAAARQSPTQEKGSRGLGISAWGLVGVILTVIIGGIAIYYVVLFYPIICKKERKYDIMELSSV